ncbi:MAG: hypothetical protein LBI45_02130 [Bacteroidales bacterium]|nr:hypothetical protein [Bacteroidales bacterium]
MSWKISIGNYNLKMIESVNIKRSVESLVDTAKITLPATVFNKALTVNNKPFEEIIKRGDSVNIELGYDDNPHAEFEGYVESISTDGGSLVLNCEDGIFLYRVEIPNKEFANAKVKDILNYVNSEVGKKQDKKFSLECDYDFSYDKFVIKSANGYDVLKKIQEEAMPNIYLKEDILHIHPQYSEIFGEVKYDFSKNIDAEGTDLKYKKKENRRVKVTIEYTGSDGKTKKYEFGDMGGESVTKKTSTSNQDSIKLLAKQEYESKSYDGYEGSFQGWLIPYCDAGYKATITDPDYEYKDGTYYVLEVETNFGEQGGVRKVTLGKIISK